MRVPKSGGSGACGFPRIAAADPWRTVGGLAFVPADSRSDVLGLRYRTRHALARSRRSIADGGTSRQTCMSAIDTSSSLFARLQRELAAECPQQTHSGRVHGDEPSRRCAPGAGHRSSPRLFRPRLRTQILSANWPAAIALDAACHLRPQTAQDLLRQTVADPFGLASGRWFIDQVRHQGSLRAVGTRHRRIDPEVGQPDIRDQHVSALALQVQSGPQPTSLMRLLTTSTAPGFSATRSACPRPWRTPAGW